jgi:hypothetical protein
MVRRKTAVGMPKKGTASKRKGSIIYNSLCLCTYDTADQGLLLSTEQTAKRKKMTATESEIPFEDPFDASNEMIGSPDHCSTA